MQNNIKRFAFRHAIGTGFAVSIASIINFYFSFSHEFWIILAVFFICQSDRDAPLRQSLIYFSVMIIGIIISSLFGIIIDEPKIITIIIFLFFIISSYFLSQYPFKFHHFYFYILIFSIIFLLSILIPLKSETTFQNRIIDITLGSLIGIVCQFLVLPQKLDFKFRQGVIPVLKLLNEYSLMLIDYLFQPNRHEISSLDKKNQIEIAFQSCVSLYPEWVYEVGFNRGLRSGLRYFLIHLEQVAELFFSMQYLVTRQIDPLLLNNLRESITKVMHNNQELLQHLILYFENKKYTESTADFTRDMKELENELQRILPSNYELMEFSPDYLRLTTLVRDLKDCRQLLLQLVMTLTPEKQSRS